MYNVCQFVDRNIINLNLELFLSSSVLFCYVALVYMDTYAHVCICIHESLYVCIYIYII